MTAPRRAPTVAALRAQLADARVRLAVVLALHQPLELADRPICRECLAGHPCRTVLTLQGVAPTPTPPEEGSQ